MIRLAVVSGKGGTGKTVVTAGFAALADRPLLLADCDVEAANLERLVWARWARKSPFEGAETAVIDPEKCWGCGRCAELCRFDAITLGDVAVAVCEPRDCEGCGLCERVCPNGAITLQPRISGVVLRSTTDYGPLSHARLYPGSGNRPPGPDRGAPGREAPGIGRPAADRRSARDRLPAHLDRRRHGRGRGRRRAEPLGPPRPPARGRCLPALRPAYLCP